MGWGSGVAMRCAIRSQTGFGSHVAVAVAAVALIWPLAWKRPYAVGAAQEIAKKKKPKIEDTAQGTISSHL